MTEYHSDYLARVHWSAGVGGDRYEVPVTAQDHRALALELLDRAGGGDTMARIAAAQVHAILALTAPDAAGPEGGGQ